MKILSIPLVGHDSSITILEDGQITSYKMEERFSREKHDLGYTKILNKLIEEKNTNFDTIIVTIHYLDHFLYPQDLLLKKLKKFTYNDLIICNNHHHLYHSFCGFYNSKFSEALCFSLDGSGMFIENDEGDEKYIETESIFYLNKTVLEKNSIIYKKYRIFQEHEKIYYYTGLCKNNKIINLDSHSVVKNEESVGEKFSQFSDETCGFSHHDAGKVMGLGQYKNYKDKLEYPYNTKEWKERVDGAYEIQQETQNHVLNLIKKYTEETGVKNVVISGGYGLNCVANYHFLKNLKDINLYIDPICFDAGISIGAAYYHSQDKSKIKPLQNVYIGHKEKSYDLTKLETKKVSYDDVVNLILQQNIVALFQGKSEAGQRALGNRSLLFDPRNPKGKDIVNQIKKRENFRPFAGTILLEEAHKWFNMLSLKESPYMQYAVDAYQNAIDQIPAIIHVDNTCRIQTVTQNQNQDFYNLIKCFYEKTGVPMLMNTSFNLGGEPLVETFEHAIYTLKYSMIEYLYLPEIETLITVKNKKLMYK